MQVAGTYWNISRVPGICGILFYVTLSSWQPQDEGFMISILWKEKQAQYGKRSDLW